ncbi:MAG: helix-turn-helix domain-containing protein [Coriobacteriia bacterium]
MTPLRLRLREFREGKGLTQLALSERANVRQATISEMESGTRQRVDLAILERLAKALDVEPGALIVSEPRKRAQRP